MRTLVLLLVLLTGATFTRADNLKYGLYFPKTAWSKTDAFNDWYWPLKKGKILTYRGTVKWTVANSTPPLVKEKVITWKMKVVATFRRDQLFAALVKGMPQDLCWYDEAKKPGLYLIVRVGAGHYFLEDNPVRVQQIFTAN